MLNFEEFKNTIASSIKHYLPAEYSSSEIKISTVAKNNTVLDAITISSPHGMNICPTIYLNAFYERYMKGTDIEDVLLQIATIRVENEATESFDPNCITDINTVKDNIIPRVYNYASNKALMSNRPHRKLADLAVTYHIVLDNFNDMAASVPVTNGLMDTWKISESDLYSLAIKNLNRLSRSILSNMFDVISGMCPDVCEDVLPIDFVPMYVLSNEQKYYGASAILDTNIMQSARNILGEDFYILPSSCHEVLLVNSDSENAPDELLNMVKEVNSTSVDIADQLSDHVYKYNFETHELYIAA